MKRLTALFLVFVMLFSCAAALADAATGYAALLVYTSADDQLGACSFSDTSETEQDQSSVIVNLLNCWVAVFGKQDGSNVMTAWNDKDFTSLLNYSIDLLSRFADFQAVDQGFYAAIVYGEGDDDFLLINTAEFAADVQGTLIGIRDGD